MFGSVLIKIKLVFIIHLQQYLLTIKITNFMYNYGSESLNGLCHSSLPQVSQLHKGDADHLKLSKYQV